MELQSGREAFCEVSQSAWPRARGPLSAETQNTKSSTEMTDQQIDQLLQELSCVVSAESPLYLPLVSTLPVSAAPSPVSCVQPPPLSDGPAPPASVSSAPLSSHYSAHPPSE